MPLTVNHCIPHTSYLAAFAAFGSNVLPSLWEIVHLFVTFNATTYKDHQALVPSFLFRWFRPMFLIGAILYDIGILAFCIATENITAILIAVRIAMSLVNLWDQVRAHPLTNSHTMSMSLPTSISFHYHISFHNIQLWLIKNWVPFFVKKGKRRFIFPRAYLTACVWFLLVGSTSWSSSWQARNDVFAALYHINLFVVCVCCGAVYYFQGGLDLLVKHRFHWARNMFVFQSFFGVIIGIVGLAIGDGGGNNLEDTLYFHSAFALIYCFVQVQIVVVVHYFIVIFEELSWKYPQTPVSEDPLDVSRSSVYSATNRTSNNRAAGHRFLSSSSKVHVDLEVPLSLIEMATRGNVSKDTIAGAPSENETVKTDATNNFPYASNKVACNDVERRHSSIEVVTTGCLPENHIISAINEEEQEDGKEQGDLEIAARGLVSQSANIDIYDTPSLINPPLTARGQPDSTVVPYHTHRRNALAFDSTTSAIVRDNISLHEIMLVKLKRHEIVGRETDKLFCVVHQMFIWQAIVWLAQIFLGLYLQSVNTPTIPGHNYYLGYYCQTPLESTVNSAQFINDFLFARRRR